MDNGLFPIADVAGTPREIGLQHGSLFTRQIGNSIRCYRDIFHDYAGLEWERAKKLSRRYIDIIGDYNPDYLEEIRGVAEGARMDFEDILALNSRSELMFAGNLLEPLEGGCTSIGITAEASANGDAIISHNWDWKAIQRQAMVRMRITQKNGKPSMLLVTEAGIIGKTGYNAAGIALFLNALSTDAAPEGLPLHIAMRGILDSESLVQALRAATRMKLGCCANFLIGARNGEIVDIEIENEDFDVLYPQNGIIVHTNHFISPRLPRSPRTDTMKYKVPDTFIRLGRARKLLAGQAGRVTPEFVRGVLQDHVEAPNCICRHDDPAQPEGLRMCSVFSMQVNLTRGEVLFAKGNPCETPYEPVALNF